MAALVDSKSLERTPEYPLETVGVESGAAIILTANSDVAGASQGTVIGTLLVSGPRSAADTFSLTNDGGGTTQVSGSSLQVGATPPSAGSVTIVVKASNGVDSDITASLSIYTAAS